MGEDLDTSKLMNPGRNWTNSLKTESCDFVFGGGREGGIPGRVFTRINSEHHCASPMVLKENSIKFI